GDLEQSSTPESSAPGDGTPAGDASPSGDASTDDGPEPEQGRAPQGDSPEAASPDPSKDVDRMTVRVTSDVGEIFGVDEREYSLYEDDVVQLPAENAEPLIQRDAAEKLE
ncbi:MAG: hypothetical protein ABEJ55_01375, partial [Halanaeroarchaeum sp.]